MCLLAEGDVDKLQISMERYSESDMTFMFSTSGESLQNSTEAVENGDIDKFSREVVIQEPNEMRSLNQQQLDFCLKSLRESNEQK